MQSIITAYWGPAAIRGARMIVKATGGIRRTYPYDDTLDPDANHMEAAKRFAAELKWGGTWHGGAYNDKGATIWVRQWHDSRDTFRLPVE